MRSAIVVAAALAATAGSAHAQEPPSMTIAYRAKQGDSLDMIAAEMYGDRGKAVFIMAENKLPRPRPLRPGERLRVPISREVTTAPGDTFESLAGTYLGSARRGPFLAELNGIPAEDSLAAGTVLTIPLTVVHTATTPESLGEIARMYFGDARQAELLRRYNFLEKRAIERNESLIVPAYTVRVAAARQPAIDTESKARRDRRHDVAAKVAKALPEARQAWKVGDYGAVKEVLGRLEPDLDYLDTDDAVDVGVLLGAAYIAHSEAEPAAAIFKRVVDRQARKVLKRYDYAPRIIAAWQAAGGQVE